MTGALRPGMYGFDSARPKFYERVDGRCFVLSPTKGGYPMFSHLFVGANDVAASKKFYDAVLGAIGIPEGKADPKGRVFYRTKTGMFGITKPIDGQAATHANGGTIGFA